MISKPIRVKTKNVTIQNDKKLYTCTKEILKYRIAGMQMKEKYKLVIRYALQRH